MEHLCLAKNFTCNGEIKPSLVSFHHMNATSLLQWCTNLLTWSILNWLLTPCNYHCLELLDFLVFKGAPCLLQMALWGNLLGWMELPPFECLILQKCWGVIHFLLVSPADMAAFIRWVMTADPIICFRPHPVNPTDIIVQLRTGAISGTQAPSWRETIKKTDATAVTTTRTKRNQDRILGTVTLMSVGTMNKTNLEVPDTSTGKEAGPTTMEAIEMRERGARHHTAAETMTSVTYQRTAVIRAIGFTNKFGGSKKKNLESRNVFALNSTRVLHGSSVWFCCLFCTRTIRKQKLCVFMFFPPSLRVLESAVHGTWHFCLQHIVEKIWAIYYFSLNGDLFLKSK